MRSWQGSSFRAAFDEEERPKAEFEDSITPIVIDIPMPYPEQTFFYMTMPPADNKNTYGRAISPHPEGWGLLCPIERNSISHKYMDSKNRTYNQISSGRDKDARYHEDQDPHDPDQENVFWHLSDMAGESPPPLAESPLLNRGVVHG